MATTAPQITPELAVQKIKVASNEMIILLNSKESNKDYSRPVQQMLAWMNYLRKNHQNSVEYVQAMNEILKIGEQFPQYKGWCRSIVTGKIMGPKIEKENKILQPKNPKTEKTMEQAANIIITEINKLSRLDKIEKTPENWKSLQQIFAWGRYMQQNQEHNPAAYQNVKAVIDHASEKHPEIAAFFNTTKEAKKEKNITALELEARIRNYVNVFTKEVQCKSMINTDEIDDCKYSLNNLKNELIQNKMYFGVEDFKNLYILLEEKINFCEEVIQYSSEISHIFS